MVTTWNEHVRDHPRLAAVRLPVAKDRLAKIRTRLGERCWGEKFVEALDRLPLPEMPTAGAQWQPDLWWLTRAPSHVDQILEGKCQWRATAGQPPETPKGRSVLDD